MKYAKYSFMNHSLPSEKISSFSLKNPESQNFLKDHASFQKQSSVDSYSDLVEDNEELERNKKNRRSALFISKTRFLQIIQQQISEIFHQDQSIRYNIMFVGKRKK